MSDPQQPYPPQEPYLSQEPYPPQGGYAQPPSLPGQPLGYYAAPAFDRPPRLRGGAKAVAVVNIVLGSVGLLAVCGLPQYFVRFGPPNPAMDMIRDDAFMKPYMISVTVLSVVLSGFVLAAGVKSYRLNPAGRSMTVLLAMIQIAFGLIGSAVNLLYFAPKLRTLGQQHPANPGLRYADIGRDVGYFIAALGMAYHVLAIYVFTRPDVEDAVRADREPPLPSGGAWPPAGPQSFGP